MSYLRTGRSVKIVGVRTSKSEPAYRMHRPDKTDEALRAEQVATQEAKRESTIEERQRLTQSSLTLQSYQAGGLSSNANYLSSLSDGHKTSSVTTATTIAAVQNEGSPAPKKGKKGRAVGAAESPVSLSSLLCYTPSAVAIELALLSGLREQLQQARVDCASYVRTSHYLSHNLRFVRDVFFLGQPDLYAPIRELCLSLTDWSTYSEASLTSKRGYGNRASDVAFMGECIASAMLEKVPKGGVRHVSVQLRADSVSSQPCGSSRNKVELLREALAPLRSIPLSALSSSGNLTHAQAQGRGADRGVVDEVTLLTAVSSLHVDLLHQWPLTYFLDAAQLRGLNASLRFLMLITATRWAAEYWWMDVISNDSLNTAASACNPKSGARYAGYSSSRRLLSAQDLYLGDVLQAKRNARAGLGIWLHCVTSLNNIFMAHIHRTLWPEFEESLLSHEDSLLQMKADLRYVVEGASASLLLLREDILEVVVLGFAAAQALREAIIVEQAELSVVVDHNTKLHAAQWKKAAPLRKANREAEAKAAKRKDAPKPWRIAKSNNAQLARTSSAHSMKSDADSVFSGLDADEMLGAEKEEEGEEAMSLRTSAAVLIAYRAAEDAFAALKGAVEGLKAVVFGAVRSRLAVGKVDREGKALEELHMALS